MLPIVTIFLSKYNKACYNDTITTKGTIMKLKYIIFIILLIILIGSGIIVYQEFYKNTKISYETSQALKVEKSKYHISGSWWGYNQKKIASIGDITFSYNYDNSNLDYGNVSQYNPFKCHLTMIIEEDIIIFDHVNTNANCNVLTDTL